MLLPAESAASCRPGVVLLLVSCQPWCATASGTMALMVPVMLAQGPEWGPERWASACWGWLGPEWCCWLPVKLTVPELWLTDSKEPLQVGWEGRSSGARQARRHQHSGHEHNSCS